MAPVCSRPVIAAGGPPRRQPYRGGPFWRYPIARMTEGIPVAMSKATSRAMSGVLKRYEGQALSIGSTPTIGSSLPIYWTEQPAFDDRQGNKRRRVSF